MTFTVRLVGGSSNYYGRVEVHYNGEWGRVCRTGWDNTDAGVVCRQLGLGASGIAVSHDYGTGLGPFWLVDVACSGHESNLSSCSHRGVGVENCHHSQEAQVACHGKICVCLFVYKVLIEY